MAEIAFRYERKMNPVLVISNWFWAIAIAITVANAAIFQARANKHVQQNPELGEGYRKIIKGFVIWGNLPWVVMGVGLLAGGVPSMFHFFRPRDGDPFVLMFFGSVFLLWILGTYWLLFKNGAEMIVRHPGVFNVGVKSPTIVKILWFLCLASGFTAVIVMFFYDLPVSVEW